MKTRESTQDHKEFNDAMIDAIRPFQHRLRPDEMLAIASHLVGAILAMQDQRIMNRDKAMTIVINNIELGNKRAIEELLDSKGTA